MICNRQIYNFFSITKTTKQHKTTEKRERVKERMRPRQDFGVWGFTPFDPTGTHTRAHTQMHTYHYMRY